MDIETFNMEKDWGITEYATIGIIVGVIGFGIGMISTNKYDLFGIKLWFGW